MGDSNIKTISNTYREKGGKLRENKGGFYTKSDKNVMTRKIEILPLLHITYQTTFF